MLTRPWDGGKLPAKCPKSHLYGVLEPSAAALGAFSMMTVSLNQAKRHSTVFKEGGILEPSEAALDCFPR